MIEAILSLLNFVITSNWSPCLPPCPGSVPSRGARVTTALLCSDPPNGFMSLRAVTADLKVIYQPSESVCSRPLIQPPAPLGHLPTHSLYPHGFLSFSRHFRHPSPTSCPGICTRVHLPRRLSVVMPKWPAPIPLSFCFLVTFSVRLSPDQFKITIPSPSPHQCRSYFPVHLLLHNIYHQQIHACSLLVNCLFSSIKKSLLWG